MPKLGQDMDPWVAWLKKAHGQAEQGCEELKTSPAAGLKWGLGLWVGYREPRGLGRDRKAH